MQIRSPFFLELLGDKYHRIFGVWRANQRARLTLSTVSVYTNKGYSSIQFWNRTCCEKYLTNNKHNNLYLEWKYARIFDRRHYLFLKAHSFPRVTRMEKCSLLGTDNVHGQISENIFAPNRGYCYCRLLFKPFSFCLYPKWCVKIF